MKASDLFRWLLIVVALILAGVAWLSAVHVIHGAPVWVLPSAVLAIIVAVAIP